MIRCVIYDCDGVLVDSLEANRKLYDHICLAMGRGPLTDDELKFCHANTVFDGIRLLFREMPGVEEKALLFLKGLQLKEYVAYLTLEPNIIEALGRLRERKILTAICTNRTTSMPHLMERFQLHPYFDLVVTALDVAHTKPHPESVEKILSTLALKPEETLYVGDTDMDRTTARNGHVRFVAYKNREISDGLAMDDHLDVIGLLGTASPR